MARYTERSSMTSVKSSNGNRASMTSEGRGFGNLFTVVLAGGAGVLIGATATVAGHIRATHDRLQRASEPGRQASTSERLVTNTNGMPLTTITHAGKPGDPINVQIEATDGQIGAAFASAGWYRADETDLVTAVRISADSVMGRDYSTAPVSDLFLYGRKEDLAFERPGDSVRHRDHIRLWNMGQQAGDGRPRWIGSGTKDIKVELKKTNHLPTHGISPDVDAEREMLISELAQTGFVVGEGKVAGFGRQTHGHNGGGDPYFTDGEVVVLTLADVWAPPSALPVRGKLAARLTRSIASVGRRLLPKEGQDRADREFARLNQQASQSTPIA
jgi:LssY C-terminus